MLIIVKTNKMKADIKFKRIIVQIMEWKSVLTTLSF